MDHVDKGKPAKAVDSPFEVSPFADPPPYTVGPPRWAILNDLAGITDSGDSLEHRMAASRKAANTAKRRARWRAARR